MKLEVGMYVRFDYHRLTVPIQISKIEEKHYEDIEKYYYYLTDNGLVISEEQIIKASNNIIDLIEVGDYVNGYYVEDVLKTFVNVAVGSNYFQSPTIYEKDIKSIVTKEQFSSMEYRLGDDK